MTYATTKAYIVKDCTIDTTINTPTIAQVGLVTGATYEFAVGKCVAEDGIYPVMGCQVDGSITKSGADIADVTMDNFMNYIYADVPSVDTVESWVPVIDGDTTYYHGNYGVKTAGGESSDDL